MWYLVVWHFSCVVFFWPVWFPLTLYPKCIMWFQPSITSCWGFMWYVSYVVFSSVIYFTCLGFFLACVVAMNSAQNVYHVVLSEHYALLGVYVVCQLRGIQLCGIFLACVVAMNCAQNVSCGSVWYSALFTLTYIIFCTSLRSKYQKLIKTRNSTPHTF